MLLCGMGVAWVLMLLVGAKALVALSEKMA